jgi:hypothetical protein
MLKESDLVLTQLVQRRLLMTTFALLIAVAALGIGRPPRVAAAADFDFVGGFETATVAVGEEVTLTVDVTAPSGASIYFFIGLWRDGSDLDSIGLRPVSVDLSGNCTNTDLALVNWAVGGNIVMTGTTCTVTAVWEGNIIGSYSVKNIGGIYNIGEWTVDMTANTGSGDVDLTAESFSDLDLSIEVVPYVAPEEPEAPAFCDLTPDMAVSPQFIELAPGGQATVEVAMRNLCADAPTVPGDLLVSFSDGLSVVDGSEGMLNLGQRAAVQAFALNPGETRRWTVTVEAATALTAAPEHISEYYVGGRVVNRIDGVFITPAPIAAAPALAEPVVVSPVPAAPSTPTSLPNTSGAAGLLPQLMLALSLAAGGAALRRKG